MSYILDALKKAEAERRGATPPATVVPTTHYGRTRRDSVWRTPWPWALLSAAVVTTGGVAWFALHADQARHASSPETPQIVAQAPTAPSTTSVPVAPPSAAPSVTPLPQTASPAPATAQPVPPPSPPKAKTEGKPEAGSEKPPTAPQPAQVEKPARKPVEKKPVPEAVRKPAPAAPDTTAQSAATTPPPEPAVGSLRELPPQIQQEIPALKIGGYIYSANKADRSVLINKRLLREGDEIAPGLTLERMTPSGMILNYKGYRYRSLY